MSDKFKVGQVVQLISGGPKMTVAEIGKKRSALDDLTGRLKCEWFAGSKHQVHWFEIGVLKTVEEAEKGGK